MVSVLQRADRRAAGSSELGILVASCGREASAAELYVREQLTFAACGTFFFKKNLISWDGGGDRRWSQSVTATFFFLNQGSKKSLLS